MQEQASKQIVRRWNVWFIGGLLALVALAFGGLHLLHSMQKSRLAVDHREAAFRAYEQGSYDVALGHLGHVLQAAPNDLEAVLAFARSVEKLPSPTPSQRLGQLAQYRRAIWIDPSNEEVARDGLELYLRSNLWLEASEIAHRVLATNPASQAGLLALARVAMHEERDADAEEALLRLREMHPADDEGLRLLVTLLSRRAAIQSLSARGETQRRIEELVRESVESHGASNPRLYLVRASLSERAGDEISLASARADYERALDLLPQDPQAALAAGRFYRRIGEFDLAVRWLGIALEAAHDEHEAYTLLAQTYSDRGRYGDAERILKQGLENCPRHETLLRFHLAETMLAAGQTERMRQIIAELDQSQAPPALTRYLLGRLHLIEGRPNEAIAVLESIADPVITPLAHFFLAQAHMNLNQPQRARARLMQVPEGQFDPFALGRLQLRVLAANGMYREAIRKADELIAEFPTDADLLFLKADSLIGLLLSGEGMPIHLEQLSRLQDRLATLAGQDVRVRLLRSRIEQLAGRRDRAYFSLEESLAEQPDSLELYAELVMLHLQDNDPHKARAVLEAAPESVRARSLYRVLLARTYELGGDLDRAVSHLTRGLDDFDADTTLSLQRMAAAMLQRADRIDEAIEVLVDAAARNPDEIALRVAILSMGEVQQRTTLRDRLIADIRRAEQAAGEEAAGAVWRMEQSRAHLLDPENPDPHKALALLEQVLEAQPENEKALHLLALTYREMDRIEEAIKSGQQALRVQPDQHLTKLLLVDLYGRAERYAEAEVLIEELSRLEGPKPTMLVRDRLGHRLRRGDTTSAIEDARLLVAGDPSNPRMRVLLARLLASQGQLRQALDHAQQAMNLEPSLLEAATTLVGLALELDEIDIAEKALERFEQVTDRSEAPFLLRSDVLVRKGDFEAALAVLSEGFDATGSAAIVLAQARTLVALDRIEEALAHYDRIPEDAADAPTAALEAAEQMIRQGDPQRRASSKIAFAQRAGAPRIDVLTLRWMHLGATRPPGWLDQAAAVLKEMTQLEDAGPEAFLDLARVHIERGDLREVANVLSAGLVRFPAHVELNEEQGKLHIRLGQLDQARIKAAYISSLPGGDVPSRLLQIDVLEAQQNFQPALVQLRDMLREHPDDPRGSEWRLRVLSLLERLGDQSAIGQMLEETPLEQRDEAMHERYAVHLLRTQGVEAAIEYLRGRVAERTESAELHFVLARMLLSQPPAERDAALFEAAIARDDEMNPTLARGLLLRAAAARESNDYDRAVELYERALEREPSNSFAINNLGWTLGKDMNRIGEALRLLEDGLARDPANQMLKRTYGTLLVDARRWQDALRVWRDLARAQRSDVYAKLRVAQAHIELRQPGEARQIMNEVRDIISVMRRGIEDLEPDARALFLELQQRVATTGG